MVGWQYRQSTGVNAKQKTCLSLRVFILIAKLVRIWLLSNILLSKTYMCSVVNSLITLCLVRLVLWVTPSLVDFHTIANTGLRSISRHWVVEIQRSVKRIHISLKTIRYYNIIYKLAVSMRQARGTWWEW